MQITKALVLPRRSRPSLVFAALLVVLLVPCGSALAAGSGSALPDERAFELVSPPTEGELYLPAVTISEAQLPAVVTTQSFQAAANGDAVAWVGEPATASGNGEIGGGLGNQWLSSRTATGWQSTDIDPTGSHEVRYQEFSGNLNSAFLTSAGSTPLAAEVPLGCATLYKRSAETAALSSLFATESCGHPLFAGASANESHVIFQDEAALTPNAMPATEAPPAFFPPGNPSMHSGSSGESCMFGCNLYERVDGRLQLVNLLPGVEGREGATVPNATFGGYFKAGELTSEALPAGGELPNFTHAISDDGSRVFWTDTQAGPEMEHIYVRLDGAETVQVSGPGQAQYWDATPDGRYAYYTEAGELWRFDVETRERLDLTSVAYGATGTADLEGPATGTGNITEGSNVITGVATSSGAFSVGDQIVRASGCPRISCGVPEGATIAAIGPGTLTLSAPATESATESNLTAASDEVTSLATHSGEFTVGEVIVGPGVPPGTRILEASAGKLRLSNFITTPDTGAELRTGGAGVQGVVGVNEGGEDGAYVYFVANAVLASAPNAHGEHASSGNCYTQPAAERGEGVCNLYLLHDGVITLVAELDASDDWIAGGREYIRHTGDWVANEGARIAQVTPDGKHLVFQSHRPLTGYDNTFNGNPTLEVFVYSAEGGQLACASCDPAGTPPSIQEREGDGGTKLPEDSEYDQTFAPRLISESGGRVFFDSQQPLVPQDANGVQDVYEWEREGEGTCTPSAPARSNDGCLFLISGGVSSYASFLVEADATGENVFFEHVGRLGQTGVPTDANLLYDARVGGGLATTSKACTGTGCQGVPPGSPIFATPASATFSGIGNFPPAPSAMPSGRSAKRSQRLAKALRSCRKDRRKRGRERCEKRTRKRYAGVKAKRSRASNERRAQS